MSEPEKNPPQSSEDAAAPEPPPRGPGDDADVGVDGELGEYADDIVIDPQEFGGPTSRRWGTIVLVVLNLGVGLAMAWSGVSVLYASPGDIIASGAVEPARLWSGEVWRLLSACFVHVGSWHLGLNLWVLWQVGRALERLVGTPRLLLVYLSSGIFGFALSLALMPGLTAGASGAVFGVTGALLAIALLTRQRALGRFLLSAFLPFVVATFALGVLLPMVNNVAHFGGLLMGFLLTYGLCAGDRSFALADPTTAATLAEASGSPLERALGGVAIVASLITFALVTAYAVDPRWSPRFHVIMGLHALHDAALMPSAASAETKLAIEEARTHASRATELGADDAGPLLLQARLLEVEGKAQAARVAAEAAFVRYGGGSDAVGAFETAVRELGLSEPAGHDDGEMPYTDGFTVRMLCTAALEDSTGPAAAVKNSCAWLLLRAHEVVVRDPARALPWAKEAFEESAQKDAAITHTFASALAQNNAAKEGLALLERLVVQGDADGLDPAFLNAERGRFQLLAAEQSRIMAGAAGAPEQAAQPAQQSPDKVRFPDESR